MAANNDINDRKIIDSINQIVAACNGPFSEVNITLLLSGIDILVDDYPIQRQIVMFMKQWFETRFAQLATYRFNADNVALVKRWFHENYREWLNIHLPSDNMGSVMSILQSLHVRLAALERLRD